MMIDELIRQLKNPDPDVRKRAIMALGKAKDPTALKALADVVRNDPDPTLRNLALKAGQYIRQQTKKSTRGPEDKDLPTTGMLVRRPPKNAPPTPPPPRLRRSERKALEAQPQPPPSKKVVRPLEQTGELPETGALLGKITPSAPPAPPTPPAPTPKTPVNPPAPRSASPFISEPDEDEIDIGYEDSPTPVESSDHLADFSFSFDDEPPEAAYSAPSASIPLDLDDEPSLESFGTAANAPLDLDDDEPPMEPLRAPPLYFEEEAPPKPDEPQPLVEGSSIVKGRKYNVSKQDEDRAHGYVNAALTFNLEGDNAKAMKNLTQAISINPNLINDAFFSNVAASVTGMEGDAAAQMIIDRNERKRFTDNATRKQKDQRVEKHLTEAKQSGWADVGFEIGFFAFVVIVGTIVATIVANEALKQLLGNFAQLTKDTPQLLEAQASLSKVTLGTILPSSIVSGIISVVTVLFQTVLIHYLAKMMHGIGTWRHLVQVLLSFYNRWTWLLFVILCISIFLGIATVSPVTLCPTIVLLILSLYVVGQTSSKVGEAYDFGGAKGCVTVILSSLVIILINFLVFYVMFQAVSLTVGKITTG
ncbi:MAG: hypothetical protein GC204_00755 [Chloroflexi bacterium]|nr:hypothetical protein [Chloroflexota bacterium]